MYELMTYLKGRTGRLERDPSGLGFTYHCTNGYTVHVGWSPLNYCAARGNLLQDGGSLDWQPRDSPDAEVHVERPNGSTAWLSTFDQVLGWQSPFQVLTVIDNVESYPGQEARAEHV